MSKAIGVLFTFTTYGTHLPGAESGSVSRRSRNWGSATLPSALDFEQQARRLMTEPAFVLGPQDRQLVLDAMVKTCTDRRWHLYCVHVRTNHVHAVLQADIPVERALAYLKARATFVLRTLHPYRQRFWTKHGSTRYVWGRTSLAAAWDYVVNGQGVPLELWIAPGVV